MIELGSTIGGKYRIEQPIARGGMGEIYAATQLKLGIKVALKFLRKEHTENVAVVDRFMAEAQAVAQLRSENVCRVSDVDVTADGVPFIVMELLQGRDLQTVLKTAPLDVATATNYVLQSCLAIAEAHGLGIVHRDIKPANLFLTYRSDSTAIIKVLDFGVAKTLPKADDHGMTQTQTVIGSPGYMSPEQLRSSKQVDARTDLWSLGVVLYELVMGKRPWTAEAITELTLKVANDPPPPMHAEIDPAFVEVVFKCLRKEPGERYHHIAALAAALAPFTPEGTELARGVRRVLGATATGPVDKIDSEDVTVSPAPVVPTVVLEPKLAEPPTTLGSASGVVQPVTTLRKKFPIVPAAIGTVIAIGLVFAIVAFTGGSSDQPAVRDEPVHAATPVEPAKPVVPADAALSEPVAVPAPVHVPTPVTKTPSKAKPTPAKGKPGKRPTIEEVRDSRI